MTGDMPISMANMNATGIVKEESLISLLLVLNIYVNNVRIAINGVYSYTNVKHPRHDLFIWNYTDVHE